MYVLADLLHCNKITTKSDALNTVLFLGEPLIKRTVKVNYKKRSRSPSDSIIEVICIDFLLSLEKNLFVQ